MSNVLALIGAGLLANATWMCLQRLLARGVATGRVVDHEATATSGSIESGGPPTTVYRPVIEFTTGAQRVRFTAVGGDTERRPPRGSRMPVRFRPGHPETAYVATVAQLWVMPLVWAAAGAIALYVARMY